MKRSVRRVCNRRHSAKWAALSSVLGGSTALLQFVPQSWPVWVGISLTVAAFAVAGVSTFVDPDHA